jgi:ribosome biogenesis GTPase / thiamine phosphate phosphatase
LDRLDGLIIRSQSGFYTIETQDGPMVCQMRGRLKKGPRQGDVVALGDHVKVTPLGPGSGVIEEVVPRQRVFSRMAPNPQGMYQQILVANPDQVLLVFACADPQPHFGMVDRFLVIAERQGIPALIVANKVDLVGLEMAQAMFKHYEPLGYPVVFTSVHSGEGISDLKKYLFDKLSLLTGPSGVGKSSILNVIQPGLGLAVNEVSSATSKGRHTTVVRELFPLIGGGYIADTPGIKALALWDIAPEELDAYFPELRSLVKNCQFSDCTHVHEPDCAVLQAVTDGRIHPDRYHSYLRMRFGDEG